MTTRSRRYRREPQRSRQAERRPATPAGSAPLPAWLPHAVYAVLTIVLFREFVFSREMLFGTDTMALGYFARHFYAEFVATTGSFPLWNPLVFGGLPFVDGMHGDKFYPTTLLLFLQDTHRAIGWKLVLHVFLAGVFMHLWLRGLGLARGPAFFGGLVYMLGAHLVSLVYPGHDGKMFVATLTPLMFWLTERAVTHRGVSDFAWLGLGVALLIYTAHMQLAYFAVWGFSLYFVFRLVVIWRAERASGEPAARPAGTVARLVGLFALAGVLGAGGAAVQLVPPFVYLQEWSHRVDRTLEADRHEAFEYATSWSLHPEEVMALVVPEFVGANLQTERGPIETYWGRNPFKLNHEYAGFLPLLLAPLLFLRRRHPRDWFFLGLAGLALLYAVGDTTPIFRVFYHLIPGVALFRAPSSIAFLFAFSVVTLGAFALARLLDWGRAAAEGGAGRRSSAGGVGRVGKGSAAGAGAARGPARAGEGTAAGAGRSGEGSSGAKDAAEGPGQGRVGGGGPKGATSGAGTPADAGLARRYLWGATAVFGLLALLASAGAITSFWTAVVYPDIGPDRLQALQRNLPNIQLGFWITFFLAGVTAAIFEGRARGMLDARAVVAAIALLAVVDLWRVNHDFILTVDPAPYWGADDTVAFLQGRRADPEPFRVFELGQAGIGIPRAYLQNYLAFHGLEELAGHHGNEIGRYRQLLGGEQPVHLVTSDLRLLDLTNVVYLISAQPIQAPGYEEVHRGMRSVVYRNERALPRAFLVGEVEVVPEDEAVDRILAEDFDFRRVAQVPEPLPAGLEPEPEPQGEVAWTARGVNEYALRVTTDRPALLVVTDNYYPAWQVEVNGEPGTILRANHTFRAVPLEAGEHELRFFYRSDVLRASMWATFLVLGLLVVAGLAGSALPALRRRRVGASVGPEPGSAAGDG